MTSYLTACLLSFLFCQITSIDVRFKCDSGQAVGPSLGSWSSTVLVHQDTKFINFTCWLENKPGSTERIRLSSLSSSINAGHDVILTLRNSTWERSFMFPKLSDGSEWRMAIGSDLLHSVEAGAGQWSPVEDYLYSVSLDTGLFSTQGSMVLLTCQPVFFQPLGEESHVTNMSAGSYSNSSRILSRHLPCSGNIWVIASVTASDVFIAISHDGFNYNRFQWYRITDSLREACEESFDWSNCDFAKLELTDIIITNRHLLLDTSTGLYLSSITVIGSTTPIEQLAWKRVDPLHDSVPGEHRRLGVDYTPICLDRLRTSVIQESLTIPYLSLSQTTARVCTADGNSLELWNCLELTFSRNNSVIHHIAAHRHTDSIIVIYQSETSSRLAVIILDSSTREPLFPAFQLPVRCRVDRVVIHPHSGHVFLLGNAVLMSSDGGASFAKILLTKANSRVTDIIFNSDSRHSELLALIETDKGSIEIAYGTIASHRMRVVAYRSGPLSARLVVNSAKTVELLSLQDGQFVREVIESLDTRLKQRIKLETPLAVQSLSPHDIMAYEVMPVDQTGGVFEEYFIGQILAHQSGLRAMVTDVCTAADGASRTKIQLYVMEDDSLSSLTELGPCTILIEAFEGDSATITALHDDEFKDPRLATRLGWTVVTADGALYLITRSHNSSSIEAVIIDSKRSEPHTITSGLWKLVNFSASSWWLEEDKCHQSVQIELPSSQNIMNLDLGSKIDLQVYASSYGSHYSHSLNLVVELSNPLMLHKDTQARRVGSLLKTSVTLTDRIRRRGVSSLMVYHRHSSLLCSHNQAIYILLLRCPPHKQLVFHYPHYVSPQVLGGSLVPEDDSLVKELPVNYRPPSQLGIAIPLTSNVYNADPHQPLYKSKYAISQQTAVFKYNRSCYRQANADSHDCGCGRVSSTSRLVSNSDCIKIVHRLLQPAQLYMCLSIQSLNVTSNNLYHTRLLDQHTVTLEEVNNRTDFRVHKDKPNHITVNLSPSVTAGSGVEYRLTPCDVRIELVNSGLYHFRSRVVTDISFCTLITEFVVYVEGGTPPQAFLLITNSGSIIGLGVVIFVVYSSSSLMRGSKNSVKANGRISVAAR